MAKQKSKTSPMFIHARFLFNGFTFTELEQNKHKATHKIIAVIA